MVYESQGDELEKMFSSMGYDLSAGTREDAIDRLSHFIPILRFILRDAARREFAAQRWSFRGSIDVYSGRLEKVRSQLIPTLGTDRFYELF